MFIDFWELKGAKKKIQISRTKNRAYRPNIYTISLPKFYMLIDPGCLPNLIRVPSYFQVFVWTLKHSNLVGTKW